MSRASSSGSPLRVGIVGFGAAARAFIPALQRHPGFELAAITEPSPVVGQAIRDELGLVAFATLPEMLTGASLDLVYVATPTDLHSQHVLTAIAAGRHVLVEKPMAVSIDDAKAMVDAAEAAGVLLMVGHSHSYDEPIRRMRDIIVGGSLGRVGMVNTWCYTDWVYRPRRPDELSTALGGGVTYRQGSHQFDIIRLLCGGRVRSVRARAFDWDPARSTVGAHVVFLDFEDGPAATAVYNGYGGFSSMDLGFDISEWGFLEPPDNRRWTLRPAPGRPPVDELAAKRARATSAIPGAAAPFQPFFGLTLVSCERGDIRQSPKGLFVHSADGVTEIPLSTECSPRDLVLAELHDAVTGRAQVTHDGRWGLANLAVCEAAVESSATRREVAVDHQVSVPMR